MNIAIIGGGPAGLRAAEVAALGGATVDLYDAKASVGRKFLVAGRGGLNLTKQEPSERFARQYVSAGFPDVFWDNLVAEFDPAALRDWAAGLGVETFAASTGRVYPREMKAAPLLRRWVERLRGLGVRFHLHHCWTGMERGKPWRLFFEHERRTQERQADAVILALGGGSWPETGSDGRWIGAVENLGVAVSPLQPANCGWELNWPQSVLDEAEGLPLKNVRVRAGHQEAVGELLVTKYGLEGGAIYQLGATLRAMSRPVLTIDFKPSFSAEELVAKLKGVRANLLSEARWRWKLSKGAWAILSNFCEGASSAEALAKIAKHCELALTGPRPLAEAISSAGGVQTDELDENLMIRRCPGVFLAGEMIDWEAPTGGYLMQACFAMGTRAARGALGWAQ